jgi:hypothetical protein
MEKIFEKLKDKVLPRRKSKIDSRPAGKSMDENDRLELIYNNTDPTIE